MTIFGFLQIVSSNQSAGLSKLIEPSLAANENIAENWRERMEHSRVFYRQLIIFLRETERERETETEGERERERERYSWI